MVEEIGDSIRKLEKLRTTIIRQQIEITIICNPTFGWAIGEDQLDSKLLHYTSDKTNNLDVSQLSIFFLPWHKNSLKDDEESNRIIEASRLISQLRKRSRSRAGYCRIHPNTGIWKRKTLMDGQKQPKRTMHPYISTMIPTTGQRTNIRRSPSINDIVPL